MLTLIKGLHIIKRSVLSSTKEIRVRDDAQSGMITEWCPCTGSGEGHRGGGEGSGKMPLVLYMYLLAGQ